MSYIIDVMNKIVKSVSQAGTVKKVDMDRVSVIPDGSASALRGVIFSGDASKVKPGDRVSLIKYQGRYVAFKQGDVPTSDQAATELVDEANLATAGHLHTGVYAPAKHNHDGELAPVLRNVTYNINADGSGDFTTLQGAINALKGIVADGVTLKLAPGTYSEWVSIQGINATLAGDLVIQGDTRTYAGHTYVCGDGTHLLPNVMGSALGNVTITRSGNTYNVTGSSANPNFSGAGWGAGDKCIISINAGVPAIYTVASTSGNTITFTTTPGAPAYGTTLTLCPNVKVANPAPGGQAVVYANQVCTLKGLWIDSSTAAGNCLQVKGHDCAASNMLCTTNAGICFFITDAGNLSGSGSAIGMVGTKAGIAFNASGCILANMKNCVSVNVAYAGFCDHGYADYSANQMVGCSYGVFAANYGAVLASGAYIVLTTIGYQCQWQSYISAVSTIAKNWAVTTAYSPATSGTVGNFNSIIQCS